jgi:hypothetical protein
VAPISPATYLIGERPFTVKPPEPPVPFVVAREFKRHGICDLSVDQIAAEAGVYVRTAQNAVQRRCTKGTSPVKSDRRGAART